MPYPVLELILMEKFNWTPMQIAEIPENKLRELLIVMDQRNRATTQAEELRVAEEKNKAEIEKKRTR